MGILNQQLIQAGNENLSKAARKPFSGKADDATVEIGYGGYLYSKDAEQEAMFDNTIARTGPKNNKMLLQGLGTYQYGPVGSARLSNSEGEDTMLGQMADMLKLPVDGERVTWSSGNGQKIARSFTSGAGTRSLLDQTTNGYGTPNSSGGAVAGYNGNNTYGISNWLTGGGAGTVAIEAVAEVRRDATRNEAQHLDKDFKDLGQRMVGNNDAQFGQSIVTTEASAGSAGSNTETFSPTVQVAGGLGRLPVFNA